jgi:glyoxylase I family protein
MRDLTLIRLFSEKASSPQRNFRLACDDSKTQTCPRMKIEHFALQVPDPVAMADWYVKQLGFTIARKGGEPSHARFLADSSGSIMLELYRNPAASVPDYWKADPLLMHVAYVSDNPAADRDRLVRAGAVVADELMTTPSGDAIVMLRDPWGVPIQLVKRAKPML